MDCNNLEIFILTYNRVDLLKIQLESVCNQSAKGFKVRILNNASTDNTIEMIEEMKKKYPQRDIEIITHPENIGNPNNFKKTMELANAEYCAVFHDDDVFHPKYIEHAMKCLKKHPEAVACSCYCEPLYNVTADNWARLSQEYYLWNAEDFSFYNLYGQRPSFAAEIYKTKLYKECTYHPEIYGKMHDLPFMFGIRQKGPSICLRGEYIRYRLSENQDSKDYSTGPFPDEVINVIGFLKQRIRKHKILSMILLYHYSKTLFYSDLSHSGLCWKEFQQKLIDKNIFSKFELILIKTNRLISKSLIKFLIKKYTKKSKNTF